MKRLTFLLALSILLAVLPCPVRADSPQTAAQSAILMDLTTGTVLSEQNAHQPLAPASVTKVMTLLLIMEAIDSGAIGWEDTVTTSEAAAAKGGSQVYLKVGETMSVSDMVKAIAVSSANDCACAMAEHLCGSEAAFVEKMNARAAELGMNDTHFVNCTGLDDDASAAEHKTSAYDIALMARELMTRHPDIEKYTTIWMDTIRGGSFGLANTNKLVRFYPGATGLKTGYTANAGYCLCATARRDGLSLVAVVLGADSSQDRFSACKQLLDYGFANYALVDADENATVAVTLGTSDSVTVIPGGDTRFLVEKSAKASVQTELALDDTVTAPVSRGQRLGTLTVRCGDRILSEIPMVAAEAVARLGWWQIFREVLGALCMREVS